MTVLPSFPPSSGDRTGARTDVGVVFGVVSASSPHEPGSGAGAPGVTGTLSANGRTAAVISLPDGRNFAFFGYRTSHARPDENVSTELQRVYGDLG